uniref:Protein ASPARTIC PROTEASE IN GUARD CELL 2 n=1 Tax=Rhizophora mucronata TaxID=61149 RepID=A0A2P2Q885_RHIMU
MAAASTSRAWAWVHLPGTSIWFWILEATSFGSSALLAGNATPRPTRFLTRVDRDLTSRFRVGLVFVTGSMPTVATLESRYVSTKFPTVTALSLSASSPPKR